ncbi:MAG: hypothetical protein M1833_006128 [Piccolia ochrophora]|nr:MAG: hypothetical protein M1833_006128 [Piccolia ochrophora]
MSTLIPRRPRKMEVVRETGGLLFSQCFSTPKSMIDGEPLYLFSIGHSTAELLAPFLVLNVFLTGIHSHRGRSGDEVEDGMYNMTNPRRRSNSSTHVPSGFKTKFETREPEPVFEEELHGPTPEDSLEDGEKESAADSTSAGSVEDDENAKKI